MTHILQCFYVKFKFNDAFTNVQQYIYKYSQVILCLQKQMKQSLITYSACFHADKYMSFSHAVHSLRDFYIIESRLAFMAADISSFIDSKYIFVHNLRL